MRKGEGKLLRIAGGVRESRRSRRKWRRVKKGGK